MFHLVPSDSITLVNRELRQRNVELVITGTSALKLQQDITMEMLFDDRFVVMAGPESKWSRRRKLKLTDLINERWVLPPLDSIPGGHIAQAFTAEGLEPPRAHLISFSLPLHHQLLATGRFVTMLPLSLLRFGKHLPLKLLPIDLPENRYPTGVITLSKRTLSPLAQIFLNCAREMANVSRPATFRRSPRPPA
jgi:DNA-binding transcriptional LysR family regulator